MSRSYKKSPWVNDHKAKSTKRNKQIANKKVRQSDEEMSRSSYKKISESWDISDFRWYWTKKEAKSEYENGLLSNYIYKHYPTIQKWLNYWEKCCRRK